MRESTSVGIIVSILLILGIGTLYLSLWHSSFSFSHAELSINGTYIEEQLQYTPNKDYHTLYRNFDSPVTLYPVFAKNSVSIESVRCESGQAYLQDDVADCYFFPSIQKQNYCPFTEPGEYGCTFGNIEGFIKGNHYVIDARYILQPKNLFLIHGKHYIKFVAYDGGNHGTLILNKNLFIHGDNFISASYYFPQDTVTIYIPYNGDIHGFTILENKDFDFGKNNLQLFLWIFLAFLPALSFWSIWRYFGRESSSVDMPSTISFYPQERKGWEVSVFFEPPLLVCGKQFFPTLLLDLYRRRIVDFWNKEKELYIKIVKENDSGLDEVERKFMDLLKEARKKAADKYREGDYFNLSKVLSSFRASLWVLPIAHDIKSLVKTEGKRYVSLFGSTIFYGITLALLVLVSHVLQLTAPFFFLFFFSLCLAFFVSRSTVLLQRYTKDNYVEYKHWQAFKRYLANSHSLRNIGKEAVVLWEQYLVYASALGVAKQVLKEFRRLGIINEQQLYLYRNVGATSHSFASASGVGGGGAGGGGVGGGGGGGR